MSLPKDIEAVKNNTAEIVHLMRENNALMHLIVEVLGADPEDPEALKALVARLHATKESLKAGIDNVTKG